jgi:uncharacterized protein
MEVEENPQTVIVEKIKEGDQNSLRDWIYKYIFQNTPESHESLKDLYGHAISAKNIDLFSELIIASDEQEPEFEDSKSLLSLCVDNDFSEGIKVLLNSGTDINHQDKNGDTVIMTSIRNQKLETFKLLFKYGLDINLEIKDSEELDIEYLIEKIEDEKIKNKYLQTLSDFQKTAIFSKDSESDALDEFDDFDPFAEDNVDFENMDSSAIDLESKHPLNKDVVADTQEEDEEGDFDEIFSMDDVLEDDEEALQEEKNWEGNLSKLTKNTDNVKIETFEGHEINSWDDGLITPEEDVMAIRKFNGVEQTTNNLQVVNSHMDSKKTSMNGTISENQSLGEMNIGDISNEAIPTGPEFNMEMGEAQTSEFNMNMEETESEEENSENALLKNINERNKAGRTPLMNFCSKGDVEKVIKLLEIGADINVKDLKGRTSLIMAAAMGHEEVVKTLLERNPKIEMRDTKGYTALMYSITKDKPSVTKILISKGANVNIAFKGLTPLMVAAQKGQAVIVNLLLEAGSDPEQKDYKGKKASDYAKAKKHMDLFNTLRKAKRIRR